MSVEANTARVRRFVEEVLAGGNFAALAELTAPDCVEHTALPGQPPGEGTVARHMVLWRAAFPELQIIIEDMIAEGDRVAVRSTACGTHRGEFLGVPPTGRRVAVATTALYRLAGGQIVERWAVVDTLALLRQLSAPLPFPEAVAEESPGAVPAYPAAGAGPTGTDDPDH